MARRKRKVDVPDLRSMEEADAWLDENGDAEPNGLQRTCSHFVNVTVRLREDQYHSLKSLADRLGIGHTTLARMMVVGQISEMGRASSRLAWVEPAESLYPRVPDTLFNLMTSGSWPGEFGDTTVPVGQLNFARIASLADAMANTGVAP